MGDNTDLSVAILLQSILDAKGFEEAQAALQKSVGGMRDAIPVQNQLADAQNVSSREIKILTAETLRSVGVTEGAASAGRLAAAAYAAMGDSAAMANLALAATGFGIAFLLPKIVEWLAHTQEQTEAQKALADQLKEDTRTLEPFLEKLKGTNAQYEAWAKHLHDLAMQEQAQKIEEQTKAVHDLGDQVNHAGMAYYLFGVRLDFWRAASEDNVDALDKLNVKLQAAQDSLNRMLLAQAKGLTVEEMNQNALKKGEGVLSDKKKAQEEYRDAVMRSTQDIIDDGKKEVRAQEEAIRIRQKNDEAMSKWIAENQAENERVQERMDRKHEQEAEAVARNDEKRQKEIQDAHQATVDAAIQLLGTLFGKNKAAALAQVVVDTAQAIMKTNAQLGWPAAIPFDVALGVEGAAQAAAIAKSGFDDPVSDEFARATGQKWARDLLNKINLGFWNETMASAGLRGGNSVSNTNVDRSTHFHGGVHLGGFFGGNETQQLVAMKRKLDTVAARHEGRVTVP